MGSESKKYITNDNDEIKIWFEWDRSCNNYYSKVQLEINGKFYFLTKESSEEFWWNMKEAIKQQFNLREPNKGGVG
jgi:hypothetical protein